MYKIKEYFDYLFKLERTDMKYDLTNIRQLLNHSGNPQNDFQSIHIAGTNGKGSTASFISSILMEHGLRAGLFTSPHILKFNERIRINGKCIIDKSVIDFLKKNRKIIQTIKPSFFEVNTAMAFDYFSRNKIDIAVIECGLGGRLDSTNVLFPELSIITQIGMDHMQYLGNTLRKIAIEKLGIVKKDVNVIVSDNNKSLRHIFKKYISPDNLLYINDILKIKTLRSGFNSRKFSYKEKNGKAKIFYIPLPGKFQAINASTAIYASNIFLKENNIRVSGNLIQRGISNVIKNSGLRCRLETIKHMRRKFIFDISHNAEGIEQTYRTLKNNKPDFIIFGMMEDKNIDKSVKILSGLSKNIIFSKAEYKRATLPSKLHKISTKYIPYSNNLHITYNIKEAIKLVFKLSDKGDVILIIGSFFMAGEAIKILKLEKHFRS